MMKTVIERFEEKYVPEPNSGCWEWTACTDTSGYGQIRFNGTLVKAHRLSYELHVGEIGDKHVLHKCDNPACVNPQHLFLGTQADNIADMVAKGRQARGKSHGSAKLTEADVLAIRADNRPQRAIAPDYGISHRLISDIKNRKIWAHVG